MSELRWESLRGEWVIVAPHRQDRTHQPDAADCPFCPTRLGGRATEIPVADFDVAVFENQFPALATRGDLEVVPGTGGPGSEPARAPAYGRCEVIVYSPQHDVSLGNLPVEHIERVIRVWTHRYQELGALPAIRYVFIFENRGAEIGVTLTHPHGQVYAYPFVPPLPARELAVERTNYEGTGHCLHCHVLNQERRGRVRLVVERPEVIAYVPFAARWPYEVHIATAAHRASLLDIEPDERHALAVTLKRVLQAYDALFDRPMPYILALRQAPTPRDVTPGSHLRIELYPARRADNKLKVRAGSETVMGVSVNEIAPEVAAASLRELCQGRG